MTGRATEPAQAPLTLEGTLHGEGGSLFGQASLSLGKAKLVARASREGTEKSAVYLDMLELPPELPAKLLEDWPLLATVGANGSLVREGNVAKFTLSATAGSAQLEAVGSVDIARWRIEGIEVHARHVNMAQLIEGALASDLAFDLSAKGSGTSLQNLDAELSLQVPLSQVAGQSLGPVRLLASARDGSFRLSELRAVLPGLTLTGAGSGTLEVLHLGGRVVATDLSALARTADALGAGGVPRISGAGALNFQLDGAPAHPGVSLSGSLESLRVSDFEVTQAQLTASVPDVRRPLEAQGQLGARTVRIGESTFREVAAKLTTRGRELEADLSARGLADLVAHLTGTLDPGADGILLSSFALQYPEARWTMRAPARVSWGGATTTIEPLTLVSGEQALSLSAVKGGRRLRAKVEASSVDLGRLPKALVNHELGLAGLLSGTVEVDGTLPRPDGLVKLTVSKGGVRRLSGISATVDSTYRRDRAVGRLSVASRSGSLDGDFDVPVSALIARRPEKVHLALNLGGLQVGEVIQGLELGVGANGVLSGTVAVDGTAEDPKLTLSLQGEGVVVDRPGAPPLSARRAVLKVASGAESRLGVRLDLWALGGESNLMLDTPFTLAGLISRTPTKDQLLDTRVGAELELKRVNLSQAAQAGLAPEGVDGLLSLRSALSGSARSPEGTAFVTVAGFAARGVPTLEATLRTVATAGAVDLTFEARSEGRTVASAKGKLGGPFRTLFDGALLGRTPIDATAELGPLAFTEVMPSQRAVAEDDDVALADKLTGVVAAKVTASGTLDAPRLEVRSTIEQLILGKTPVGKARVRYDYAASRNSVTVEFVAAGGGGLNARGEGTLELSLPALRQGLEWRKAPFQATVKADRFDLAFLSGLTPAVRLLGGKLRADATVSGELGAPGLLGSVEWSDGRLGLQGYGEYRSIHLLLDVTADRFRLRELVARSGAGSARVTAEATRSGGQFRVSGTAETQRFPIVFDDQLFALGTLRSTFRGDFTARRLEFTELAIPEAHVDLPQIKRKDLQALQRPSDIVLTRNGKPLKAPKKKKEKPPPGAPSPARQDEGFSVSVAVNAPKNLWVKGSDVNIELGLSDDFRLEYHRELQLSGEVRVLRGKAEVIGRRFELQRGSEVRFAGPANSPYINITAVHVNEREGVTVTMSISGRGKELSLKPSSQPPLSESEIYTLLATGRRTLKRGSGASITGAQAASVVGSLAASQLRGVISQKLPLDVFSIEAGEEGLAGTRVEAGTYLSDKAYLGYTGEIGADASKGENSHEVRFEYQISPRWSLEAKYGDARAGGADLIWSKDY
ncbi:MAG: translocation/assembly module TamB domain-containing protein [Myxococcaceae bacterium]